MGIPKKMIRDNIDCFFIAYANIYIEDAIKAQEQFPDAEAVVIQPFEKDRRFVSTEEALLFYEELKGNIGIPILFTPQGRAVETGQYFEYGARLIELPDVQVSEDRKSFDHNIQTNKWVLHADDRPYAQKNLLVVKAPIVALSDISETSNLPVNQAINILNPKKRGTPVEAVSIPAPKLIKEEYKYILQALESL